jgi:hypothetical protein
MKDLPFSTWSFQGFFSLGKRVVKVEIMLETVVNRLILEGVCIPCAPIPLLMYPNHTSTSE